MQQHSVRRAEAVVSERLEPVIVLRNPTGARSEALSLLSGKKRWQTGHNIVWSGERFLLSLKET